MSDDRVRGVLRTLDPSARDHLRDVLIRDDADRDAIASTLMRYRDENGQGWADIIDLLMMYPDDGSCGCSRAGSFRKHRTTLAHTGTALRDQAERMVVPDDDMGCSAVR